jgi:ubiquinone/menaquinone biosynthesis C-methylase UbiE
MYTTKLGRFAEPESVVSHFHLREGDIVADFGAGTGHYMQPLSDAVGQSGIVYLCEIQKNLVEALGNTARDRHLTNIRPLWCDVERLGGIKIQDGTLDVAILSNVLFQFQDKESALREVWRVMRKGGKLFVIDWTDSFNGLGPRSIDVVTEKSALDMLARAGFTFERLFPAGDHHYGIASRK